MKDIQFIGRSLEAIRDFPGAAKREAGYQLDRVQHGFDPVDWKPMSSIGSGVREIRIKHEGQYRVIYIAKFEGRFMSCTPSKRKRRKPASKTLMRPNEH